MERQEKEVRWSKIVCLNFIGNPVLREQLGGFDKAVLSTTLVIQSKSH